MNYESKKLEKSQVEIKIEITVEEMQPYLEKAAKQISKDRKIPGFRPGKASLDAVKQAVGEMALWQEAAEPAILHYLAEVLMKENLETIGHPAFNIDKIAPGNPLGFTATVSLLPSITLPELGSVNAKKEIDPITDKQVDETVEELRKMRRSESLVDREIKDTDKVDASLTVTVEGKEIDKQDKIEVVINDKRYIPGFEDQLLGLKKGDEKEFTLTFPKDYRAQEVAGKEGTFKVKILDVYELALPELNDEFATTVGKVATVEDLKKDLKRNLEIEADRQADQKLENEILKQLVEKSTIGDIPEALLNSEIKHMMQDFAGNLAQQGVKLDDYLQKVGKKENELMLDFAPQAAERVKSGLVMRQIVTEHKLSIDESELKEKIEMLKQMYQHSPDMLKQIESREYQQQLHSTLLSHKVLDFLKVKTGAVEDVNAAEKESTADESKEETAEPKEEPKEESNA